MAGGDAALDRASSAWAPRWSRSRPPALLLLRSASYLKDERDEALKLTLDAQRRLGELKTRRREREEMLQQLAERLGFEDVTALLREHGEHLRLTVEGQRMAWLEEDRARSAQAEAETEKAVGAWAERAKMPGDLAPQELVARLRQGIGAVLDARSKGRELDQVERRLAAQEDEAKARLASAQAEIVAVARALGLDGEAGPVVEAGQNAAQNAAQDAAQLAARADTRAKEHARLEALERELLPALEARMLSAEVRGAHEAEIARLARDIAPQGDASPGTPRRRSTRPRSSASCGRERERLDLVSRVGGRERDAVEPHRKAARRPRCSRPRSSARSASRRRSSWRRSASRSSRVRPTRAGPRACRIASTSC